MKAKPLKFEYCILFLLFSLCLILVCIRYIKDVEFVNHSKQSSFFSSYPEDSVEVNSVNGNESKLRALSTNRLSNDVEVFVYGFYTDYLQNVYLSPCCTESPMFLLTKDKNFYLETEYMFVFLHEFGYFSEEYYKNEQAKADACSARLTELDLVEVYNSGAVNPAEFLENGKECWYLDSNQWVGGQGENLDTVTVLGSVVTGDIAAVRVAIGYKHNASYSYDYSYPSVYLVRQDNEWKISSIEVSFDFDENYMFEKADVERI